MKQRLKPGKFIKVIKVCEGETGGKLLVFQDHPEHRLWTCPIESMTMVPKFQEWELED